MLCDNIDRFLRTCTYINPSKKNNCRLFVVYIIKKRIFYKKLVFVRLPIHCYDSKYDIYGLLFFLATANFRILFNWYFLGKNINISLSFIKEGFKGSPFPLFQFMFVSIRHLFSVYIWPPTLLKKTVYQSCVRVNVCIRIKWLRDNLYCQTNFSSCSNLISFDRGSHNIVIIWKDQLWT